jgi:hypothetical protein
MRLEYSCPCGAEMSIEGRDDWVPYAFRQWYDDHKRCKRTEDAQADAQAAAPTQDERGD